MDIQTIPLNDLHISLGAKMVPFAGYLMPVRYSSDLDEHFTVREHVGIFDVSHMGEILIQGPNALELIQRICSNDASVLKPQDIQYAYFPNHQGGIVDDLLVYCLAKDSYMLVVNASNIDKDFAWVEENNREEAILKNISADTCLFAVQGPKAKALLQKLTDIDLDLIPYYKFEQGTLAGIDQVLISNTGYTGAGGFELYVDQKNALQLWQKIFTLQSDFGLKPIGLGARDTLRLEMGYCLYGQDIDDTTSPLEAGLGWVTKFTKPFIHSEALKKAKDTGLSQKMLGFKMTERGIPRSGYSICTKEGEVIGRVTSGTQSPCLQIGIGMGYVNLPYAKIDQEVYIQIREKLVAAQISKMPFVPSQVK